MQATKAGLGDQKIYIYEAGYDAGRKDGHVTHAAIHIPCSVITFNYLILRAMNKRQREGMHTRSIGVN